MMTKYKLSIGLKKFAKAAVYVIIAGLAANYGQNSWYMAIAPLLTMLENYLKNK